MRRPLLCGQCCHYPEAAESHNRVISSWPANRGPVASEMRFGMAIDAVSRVPCQPSSFHASSRTLAPFSHRGIYARRLTHSPLLQPAVTILRKVLIVRRATADESGGENLFRVTRSAHAIRAESAPEERTTNSVLRISNVSGGERQQKLSFPVCRPGPRRPST